MNRIATIAFAGAIGLIGLTCAISGPANAQAFVDYKPGELVPAVTPADQRGGFVAEAYGDVLGRDAGGENGLIGLLNQENGGRKAGELVPAVMPTDQREGQGRGDFVAGVYGDLLGRDAGQGGEKMQDVHFVPAVQKNNSLTSLGSIGSVGDLFPLSRGDNGGTLVPAVQKARQTAGGNTEGGGPHVNPGVAKSLNFSNQGGKVAGGNTAVNQGILNNSASGGGNAGSTKGIIAIRTTR